MGEYHGVGAVARMGATIGTRRCAALRYVTVGFTAMYRQVVLKLRDWCKGWANLACRALYERLSSDTDGDANLACRTLFERLACDTDGEKNLAYRTLFDSYKMQTRLARGGRLFSARKMERFASRYREHCSTIRAKEGRPRRGSIERTLRQVP